MVDPDHKNCIKMGVVQDGHKNAAPLIPRCGYSAGYTFFFAGRYLQADEQVPVTDRLYMDFDGTFVCGRPTVGRAPYFLHLDLK